MSLLFELEQHQKLVVYEEGNQILAVRLPLRRGGEFRMRDGCLSDLTGVIYRGNIRLACSHWNIILFCQGRRSKVIGSC